MANSFYSRVKGFLAGTKARGSDVRFEYDAIEDAFDAMDNVLDSSGNLAVNLDGGNTYKLTNMADGVDTQDYATIANVAAGGSPGDIPITSLGIGTATADQFIRINAGGTAVVGDSPSSVAGDLAITDMGAGTSTTGQIINNSSGSIIGSDGEDVTTAYPPMFIQGLEVRPSAGDTKNDLEIQSGYCRNAADTKNLNLSSTMTKRGDAAWAKGTGNGGNQSTLIGTVGASGDTYYIFLISEDSSGDLDVYFDSDKDNANIPSGWTFERRLATRKARGNESDNTYDYRWYQMLQYGDLCVPYETQYTADTSGSYDALLNVQANAEQSGALTSLPLPGNATLTAIIGVTAQNNDSAGTNALFIRGTEGTPISVSPTTGIAGYGQLTMEQRTGGVGQLPTITKTLLIPMTTTTIYARASDALTAGNASMRVDGWYENRSEF